MAVEATGAVRKFTRKGCVGADLHNENAMMADHIDAGVVIWSSGFRTGTEGSLG